jgi:hypothetical protein
VKANSKITTNYELKRIRKEAVVDVSKDLSISLRELRKTTKYVRVVGLRAKTVAVLIARSQVARLC